MAIHFEEPLESEWERLIGEFFGQYDEDYEFEGGECERMMDAYMESHASDELKEALKRLSEFLANRPPDIR